ncbi:hypothetical protein IHE44_0005864, partial [Lamprotornis superbus]
MSPLDAGAPEACTAASRVPFNLPLKEGKQPLRVTLFVLASLHKWMIAVRYIGGYKRFKCQNYNVDTTYLPAQAGLGEVFSGDHLDSSNEREASGQDTKFWKEKAVLREELEQTILYIAVHRFTASKPYSRYYGMQWLETKLVGCKNTAVTPKAAAKVMSQQWHCSGVSPEEGEHHSSSSALESRAQSHCPRVLRSCMRWILLWAKAPACKSSANSQERQTWSQDGKGTECYSWTCHETCFSVPGVMSIVVVHPWGVRCWQNQLGKLALKYPEELRASLENRVLVKQVPAAMVCHGSELQTQLRAAQGTAVLGRPGGSHLHTSATRMKAIPICPNPKAQIVKLRDESGQEEKGIQPEKQTGTLSSWEKISLAEAEPVYQPRNGAEKLWKIVQANEESDGEREKKIYVLPQKKQLFIAAIKIQLRLVTRICRKETSHDIPSKPDESYANSGLCSRPHLILAACKGNDTCDGKREEHNWVLDAGAEGFPFLQTHRHCALETSPEESESTSPTLRCPRQRDVRNCPFLTTAPKEPEDHTRLPGGAVSQCWHMASKHGVWSLTCNVSRLRVPDAKSWECRHACADGLRIKAPTVLGAPFRTEESPDQFIWLKRHIPYSPSYWDSSSSHNTWGYTVAEQISESLAALRETAQYYMGLEPSALDPSLAVFDGDQSTLSVRICEFGHFLGVPLLLDYLHLMGIEISGD